MTLTNLSHADAQARSAAVQPDSLRIVLDLTGAADVEQSTFLTSSVLTFTTSSSSTFVDFLGELDRVSVNGEQVAVDFDGARITLDDLPINTPVRVEISGRGHYSRTGQGLHRFVDPADGNTYLYTHFEPSDARRVFATFDQPDLKQLITVEVSAPEGWTVLSNQPVRSTDNQRHLFDTTPKLSSYLVAVAAGPYHYVADEWISADGLVVPMGLACRASRVDTLDAEAIFTVMSQGLDYFDAHLGHPYPWGKYDQVFVPEYNLGAMENPGLVTFTEKVLFRSAATRAQYSARANVILHEMSHMWFGDLVTPQWWDDLWLKESFAEFMGTHACVEATEYTDNWVAFAGRRKAWAYHQDELPTTHPIIADIADVEAARQNFDGITYAKGAAVLKQLVHHVGLDTFLAAARRFFAQHAFGAATFADLVSALEHESGRDLSSWVTAWLHSSGPDLLEPIFDVRDGRISALSIVQTSLDALTGEPVGRPHSLKVGLFDLREGRLVRRRGVDVELRGQGIELISQLGEPAPALVLVNDVDQTYAKVRLDPISLATLAEHFSALDDPLVRALIWTNLQTMVRDAALRVEDYLNLVIAHAPSESDTASLGNALGFASAAIESYLPQPARPAARLRLARALDGWVTPEAADDDRAVVIRRAWAVALARTPELGEVAAAAVGLSTAERTDAARFGEQGTDNVELRWALLRALAVLGRVDADELEAQRAEYDDTLDGGVELLSCLASGVDHQLRAELTQRLVTAGAFSNDEVSAVVTGLRQPLHPSEPGQADSYFAQLTQIWSDHPQEIAERLVVGLFPSDPAVTVVAGQRWLAEHTDAPAALQRSVMELLDQAQREERAQQFNS